MARIAYADSAVGKLLRQLKVRGIYDGSVPLAVMADHGESLAPHGGGYHGSFSTMKLSMCRC